MYVRRSCIKVHFHFRIFLKSGVGKIAEPLCITIAVILFFDKLLFEW